jgi:hypothetical protein
MFDTDSKQVRTLLPLSPHSLFCQRLITSLNHPQLIMAVNTIYNRPLDKAEILLKPLSSNFLLLQPPLERYPRRNTLRRHS